MKTKFNLYISLTLLVVLSASCSQDFLEEKKNYGSYDDTFYQSQERVQAYVDNQYFEFYSAYKSPTASVVGSYTDANTKLTEELGGTQDLINPNKTLINAVDASGYYGLKIGASISNTAYNRIRECNNLLEDIDVKGATLDKTFRDQAKGQMYYMRAMQYFDLMRTYGGVPIVTIAQTASATDPSIQLPRAKVSEVVAQIVSDLDLAASLLPGNWTGAYGRFTRGAALAQKSRVLLTYASPLFNKNWDGSNERWDAALKAGLAAEAQLTTDGYGLYGSSIKDWEAMFLIDNAFCKEAITVQLCGTGITSIAINNSWEKGIRLASQGGAGGGQTAPKEMIDLFPMADGSRPTAAGSNYNDFTFFVNRDPRFYKTFSFSGAKWSTIDNANAVLWTYRWVDGTSKTGFADGNSAVSSPAFVRKMANPKVAKDANYQFSGTDIFEYRYAELLLNIAECYAALGQTNNTQTYLGRIRARVGIKSTNNYGIGTLVDKYAAIEAVLYERRVELAYEGKRFWDVQRWMLYDNASLPGIAGNTVSKLGLAPINGTQRTGNYLQYKNTAASDKTDPLTAARAGIAVDPDVANFDAKLDPQIVALANFYNNNLKRTPLTTPLDNFNGVGVQIKFNPNYYISGLNSTALTQNPWLEQTIGWNGVSGGAGTYNYQE